LIDDITDQSSSLSDPSINQKKNDAIDKTTKQKTTICCTASNSLFWVYDRSLSFG